MHISIQTYGNVECIDVAQVLFDMHQNGDNKAKILRLNLPYLKSAKCKYQNVKRFGEPWI